MVFNQMYISREPVYPRYTQTCCFVQPKFVCHFVVSVFSTGPRQSHGFPRSDRSKATSLAGAIL